MNPTANNESTVVVGGGAAGIAPLCIVLHGEPQPTLATMAFAIARRAVMSLLRVLGRH